MPTVVNYGRENLMFIVKLSYSKFDPAADHLNDDILKIRPALSV